MSVVRTVDDEQQQQQQQQQGRAHAAPALTTRQRLALVINGTVTAKDVMSADDQDLDYAFFVKHKVHPQR